MSTAGRSGRPLELPTQPQAVAATQLVVDHRDVDRLAFGDLDPVFGGSDRRYDLKVGFIGEQLTQTRSHGGVIVDDEHPRGLAGVSVSLVT